jgi:hypothetical protein
VSKATRPTIDPEALPAKVTPMHVERPIFDAETGKQILGKVGLRRETAFENFIRLGRHVCREACTDKRAADIEIERALDRRDAGNAFVEAWDIRERGTKDSTDMSRGGGAGESDGFTRARIDAIKKLRSWELHTGQNDYMLVRLVCGMGDSPAQAVARISTSYRDASLPRFREALDGLVNGQRLAAKCEWCRRGKPHGAEL